MNSMILSWGRSNVATGQGLAMTDAQFDQSAWLERIGYAGAIAPTLETLNRLILAHSHSISYETLDIMLGRPPKLDVASLQSKMITGKRGGYCFEQNMLFRAGLRSLGYRITSLQGRVVRGLEIDAQRPAIHMLLQIELPEGAYLADVGFGNLAPTAALLLEPHVEQETPHELMRFIDVGGKFQDRTLWFKIVRAEAERGRHAASPEIVCRTVPCASPFEAHGARTS